jgi:hypothetical protein
VQERVRHFWDKLTLELLKDNRCVSDAMLEEFGVIIELVPVAKVLYNFTRDVEEAIYLCRTVVRWLSAHPAFVDFLYVWGVGGCGKDFLWSLLVSLFGDDDSQYAAGAGGEMMNAMQKTGGNESASPTLMSWMGKRLVCFSELAQKPLDLDSLKPLTEQRGVKKTGRKLYQGPQSFRPTFGLLSTSQWAASITAADDTGAARRLKMWMCTTVFRALPDPNNPNEQLADESLHGAVLRGELAHSLFHLIAPAYQTLDHRICKRGEILPIPARIQEDTEAMFKTAIGFDVTLWLTENTIPVPRLSASPAKELSNKLMVASQLELRDIKAELVKAGATETANGKARMWVWRHPLWSVANPDSTAKLPGLQLKA